MKRRISAVCTMAAMLVLFGTAAAKADTKITSLPYTISSSGSYYISQSLTSTGDGINVDADDVTIDLNGNMISSVNYGILLGGNNIEVRNGTVRTTGGSAILYTTSNLVDQRVIDVRVPATGGVAGIYIGNHSVVKGCTVSNGTIHGIVTGSYSLVTGNTSYGNAQLGIMTNAGSVVIGNSAANNGGGGIYAEESVIKNNTANMNGQFGFLIGDDSLVDGNEAYGNGAGSIGPCTNCAFGVNATH